MVIVLFKHFISTWVNSTYQRMMLYFNITNIFLYWLYLANYGSFWTNNKLINSVQTKIFLSIQDILPQNSYNSNLRLVWEKHFPVIWVNLSKWWVWGCQFFFFVINVKFLLFQLKLQFLLSGTQLFEDRFISWKNYLAISLTPHFFF